MLKKKIGEQEEMENESVSSKNRKNRLNTEGGR
jgi:hypothetical protein